MTIQLFLRRSKVLAAVFGLLFGASAQAWTNFTGNLVMLEVWSSGNIAFTLSVANVPCNGQFIINASTAGAKNLYAALLLARAAGTTITVSNSVCGPADSYGGNYAIVDYLYPNAS